MKDSVFYAVWFVVGAVMLALAFAVELGGGG
jgi:hypothetical protein